MTLKSPQPLDTHHDLSQFDSGRSTLDNWLRHPAEKNERSGASRTYVVCEDARVVGYFCLSTGAVECQLAPGHVRRNMPDPVPVMLMGRLAVDKSWQGKGVGRGLLKDAMIRTLRASEIAGMRALLVHALDDDAANFYVRNGFLISPLDPLVLMLPLDTVRKTIA